MVRYTGRSGSQITKNSTNQPGLKLSGSANGVGSRFRNVGQRVTDNVKVCGPVYRHGVIWSTTLRKIAFVSHRRQNVKVLQEELVV